MIYQFTPLFATGLINSEGLKSQETYIKRKFLHLPYDIKAKVIHNMTDWHRRTLSDTIEVVYKKMILKEHQEYPRAKDHGFQIHKNGAISI